MDDKFILVPSDLYKNLLKPDTGEINVENAKRNLSAILNKKNVNKSAKNILYNNELRRFLKIRKEFENKPIKVELTDGSLMVFNPKNQTNRERIETGITTPENEEEEIGYFPTISMKDEQYDTAESDIESVRLKSQQTPKSSLDSARKRWRKRLKETTDTPIRREKILRILRNNPVDFGIDEDDKILRDNGVPYLQSNYKEALDRILHRTTENAPSPKGTRVLENRLRKDPRTSGLLSKSANILKKQRGSGFKRMKKRSKDNKIKINKWNWTRKNC